MVSRCLIYRGLSKINRASLLKRNKTSLQHSVTSIFCLNMLKVSLHRSKWVCCPSHCWVMDCTVERVVEYFAFKVCSALWCEAMNWIHSLKVRFSEARQSNKKMFQRGQELIKQPSRETATGDQSD